MKYTYLKNLLLLAVLMFGAKAADAVNYMSIDNFTLNTTAEKTVDVLYNFEQDAVGFSGTLVVPEGLEIVEVKRNESVFPEQSLFEYVPATRKFVAALFGRPLKERHGVLFTITLRASMTLLDENTTVDLKMTDLAYSYKDSDAIKGVDMPDVVTKVTATSAVIYATTSTQDFIINPGGTSLVGVGMYNTVPAAAVDVEVVLPEGTSIRPDSNGNLFSFASRVANGTVITPYPLKDANGYRVLIVNMYGKAINGSEGDFMTFSLEAPAGYAPASGSVLVRSLQVSNGITKFNGDGCDINFINGGPWYNKAMTGIAGAEQALDDVLNHIAANDPDVMGQFTGDDIKTAIGNLKDNVDKAYNDKTLPSDYDEVMAPLQDILDAIAKLKTDADAAQALWEKEQANQAAYDALMTSIADLEAKLAAARTQIADECADVKSDFTGNDIEADINTLKEDITKAYNNKTCADDAATLNERIPAIEQAITQLVNDAKAAQAEFEAEKARKAMYDEDMAIAAALDTKLADVLQQIATECPDVSGDFSGEDIANSIQNLKDAIQKAYDDKTILDDSETVMSVVPDIETAIEQLLAAAQNAQKDQTFYKQALDIYDGLMKLFNDAQATIAADCPDVKEKFKGESILDDIEAYRKSVVESLAAGTIQNDYETITAVVPGIEDSIDKLIESARTEQERYISNLEAYNADVRTLDSLQDTLDQAVADIRVKYPDYDIDSAKTDVQDAIDSSRAGALAAYEAVSDEGTYSYTVDVQGIRDLIAKMKHDAELSGVLNISVADMDNIRAIYSLEGVRLDAPVKGKPCIVVTKDGISHKVVL